MSTCAHTPVHTQAPTHENSDAHHAHNTDTKINYMCLYVVERGSVRLAYLRGMSNLTVAAWWRGREPSGCSVQPGAQNLEVL